jgi:AAHS family 4-hydroxybenzoate transporter-like MFS transporter
MIYFLMSWLPLILKQSGLTLDTAIKSAVYLNLGGMLGGIVLGRFVDRLDPFIVLASSYALAGLSISLIGFVEAPNLLMFVVFLAGFFIIGAQTAMNAVVTDVYPAQIRSTGLGTALSVGRMGSIVGPVVGGMLLAASWQMESIFIASATPAFLACVALLFLKKVMSK